MTLKTEESTAQVVVEWSHQACEVCWFRRPGNMVEDEEAGEIRFRVPHQVVDDENPVTRCCFCGSPCVTKIYVREDPTSPDLACRGEHYDREFMDG